ncbi:MAG: molybdate ABC transporter substrate-binding protein [Gammaproteobacteria bacterium]|nr:molybdate ABC transporter substrate-binding protein [Gammaproteobacteria bacterium]
MGNSAEQLNLAVANSTCTAIKQIGEQYTQQHPDITLNYICKSSGRLAKGLNGETIKAEIYISANKKWMDYMLEHGLIDPGHVSSPWGNELVVAAPATSPLQLEDWQELINDDVKTILLGDPGTAPFGRYAKESLQHTGLWDSVRIKVVTKKHITLLAETLAQSDDSTVGILFKTNVTDEHKVLCAIDDSWHSPIRYFMGPVGSAANNPVVMDLLSYIQGEDGSKIFQAAGFKVENQ